MVGASEILDTVINNLPQLLKELNTTTGWVSQEAKWSRKDKLIHLKFPSVRRLEEELMNKNRKLTPVEGNSFPEGLLHKKIFRMKKLMYTNDPPVPVSRTHSGEKPFTCEECSESFSETDELKTHLRTHSGEKPLTCKECSKSFSESGELKTHLRTHSGEKPFACKECSTSFSESGELKSHLRTHSGENPVTRSENPGRMIENKIVKKKFSFHQEPTRKVLVNLDPIVVKNYTPSVIPTKRQSKRSGKVLGSYKPRYLAGYGDSMKNGGTLVYITTSLPFQLIKWPDQILRFLVSGCR